MRTVLDTNVFLQAAGRPHPLKEACSRVLHRVADGSLEATVNAKCCRRSYTFSRGADAKPTAPFSPSTWPLCSPTCCQLPERTCSRPARSWTGMRV